jgi:hypothetical protein
MLRTLVRRCATLDEPSRVYFERLLEREEADMALTARGGVQPDSDSAAAEKDGGLPPMHPAGSLHGNAALAAETAE